MLWIVDVYPLVLAGLLVAMGSLGDRIGRRRLLLIGATGFAAVSAVAAFAPTAELLIGARALLGVFGAMLMPVHAVAPAQRRSPTASSAASRSRSGRPGSRRARRLGPIVGGLLLEHFWWGSVFLLAVPVLIPLLVLAPLLVRESRDPSPGPVDVAGHRAVAADDGADRLRHQVARGRRVLRARRRSAIAVGVSVRGALRAASAASAGADARHAAVHAPRVQRRDRRQSAERDLARRVPVLRVAAPPAGDRAERRCSRASCCCRDS